MLVVVLKAIVTMMLASPIKKFTSGMYTCPSYFFEVWITWTLGRQPSDSALERMANAPDSIAWLAMIAERMAIMKVGQDISFALEHRVYLARYAFSFP